MFTTSLMLGLVIGATLAQFFRVYVLVPTSIVLAILVYFFSLHQGCEPPRALLWAGAAVAMVQAGYILGLIPRAIPFLSRPRERSAARRQMHGQARHY